LKHEQNALLIDPLQIDAIADGMVRMVEDDEIRQHLAQAGPATAQKFSWTATAETHVALYRAWLGANR